MAACTTPQPGSGGREGPVDGDADGSIGVLAQPAAGEWAPRDDHEVIAACHRDGDAHQLASGASSTQRRRDIGVQQIQVIRRAVVHELGLLAVA